jgi:hypothetical protein
VFVDRVKSLTMRSRRVFAPVLAVLLAVSAGAPGLAAREPVSVPVHLTFRLLARGVSDLQLNGRYLSFTQTTSTKQELFDDRTGKRIVTPRGCDLGALGDPWVGVYCDLGLPDQSYEALNVRTKRLRSLPCDGLCKRDYYFQNLVAVGSRWFQVEVEPHEPCGDGIHYTCGPTTYAYYDIRTGEHKVPVVTDSETVDLNSLTLIRTLCAPLAEPAGYSPTIATAYNLTFDGSFAVAQETSGLYIERCGSHLHVPLVTPPYAGSVLQNARAIAFCSVGETTTNGFLLPTLHPFTVAAPVVAPTACPLLGPRHAYVVDAQNQVWAATLPPRIRVQAREESASPRPNVHRAAAEPPGSQLSTGVDRRSVAWVVRPAG